MQEGLELSFPPPTKPLSINEANRMHWAAKRRRLEPWREATQIAWLQARDRQHLVKGKPCTVEIHIPFPDKRRRDPHNWAATTQKVIIDALVTKTETVGVAKPISVVVWDGCWDDDNPEWVKTLEPVLYVGDLVKVRIVPNG